MSLNPRQYLLFLPLIVLLYYVKNSDKTVDDKKAL